MKQLGDCMKVKISDVAQKAGVSTATVDRVLNNREGVKPATIELVQKAIEELGFEPNRLASRLARSPLHIGFILPQVQSHFMKNLSHFILEQQKKMAAENVIIHLKHIDLWAEDVSVQLKKNAEGLDGLAVVAVDSLEFQDSIDELSEKIPVITLVSDAPHSQRKAYVGIDNFIAGRTAAGLIGRFLTSLQSGKIVIVMGSEALSDHVERKEGFEEVIYGEYPFLEVLPPIYGYDEHERVEQQLSVLLEEYHDIAAIYCLGAGNRGIVKSIKKQENPRKKIYVVTHDITEYSRKALMDGDFDVILVQHPEQEVKRSIEILLDILENRTGYSQIEKLNIGIYLRDNLPH